MYIRTPTYVHYVHIHIPTSYMDIFSFEPSLYRYTNCGYSYVRTYLLLSYVTLLVATVVVDSCPIVSTVLMELVVTSEAININYVCTPMHIYM